MAEYLPIVAAGVAIAFMLFAAYVVNRLGRSKNPGRLIVTALVALTGLFGTLPSIIEAIKR